MMILLRRSLVFETPLAIRPVSLAASAPRRRGPPDLPKTMVETVPSDTHTPTHPEQNSTVFAVLSLQTVFGTSLELIVVAAIPDYPSL